MKMKSHLLLATLLIVAQGLHLKSNDIIADPLFLEDAIHGADELTQISNKEQHHHRSHHNEEQNTQIDKIDQSAQVALQSDVNLNDRAFVKHVHHHHAEE